MTPAIRPSATRLTHRLRRSARAHIRAAAHDPLATRRAYDGSVGRRAVGQPVSRTGCWHHRACLVGSPAVTIRVVLAEDNTLLREGVARLLERAEGIELVGTAVDRPELEALIERRRPRRRGHRHPDAADRHRRGHPDRRPAPGRPARGRRGGAQPVRRAGLRPRPARRRVRGAGLPAQGAGERRRRAAGRDPRGGRGAAR